MNVVESANVQCIHTIPATLPSAGELIAARVQLDRSDLKQDSAHVISKVHRVELFPLRKSGSLEI